VIRKCLKSDLDPGRPKSEQVWCLISKKTGKVLGRHPSKVKAVKQEQAIEISKHDKIASLFSQEDIEALKNLIQKSLESAEVVPAVDYGTPNVPDSSALNPPEVKPPVMPLEQQRAIIQYASKDKLWQILDNDNAWYDLLQKALPKEYMTHFFQRMEELAIKDPKIVAEMATMFVKNKVSLDHLQSGVALFWCPDNLEESTQFLHAQGFVNNPTVPINLRADAKTARKRRLASAARHLRTI
jgi:hypothetical protein